MSREATNSAGKVWILVLQAFVLVVYGLTDGMLPLALLAMGVIVVAFLTNPPLGMAAYLITIPLEFVPLEGLNASPFAFWTSGFLVAVIGHSIVKNRLPFTVTVESKILLFLSTLLITSVVLSPYPSDAVRPLVSVILLLLVTTVCIGIVIKHRHGFYWLVCSLLIIGTIVIVLLPFFGDIRVRLEFEGDGGVRIISNALAFFFAGALLAFTRYTRLKVAMPVIPKVSTLGLFISLVCITSVVILTVSRGAMMAILMSSLVFSVGLTASHARAGLKFGLMSVCLALIGLWMWPTLDLMTSGWLSLRIEQTLIEQRGAGLRMEVWGTALSRFDTPQWIIGAGPGMFREMGTGEYEHSVFVSILHAAGLMGLATIFTLIVWWNCAAYQRNRFVIFLSIMVLVVLLFSTHGNFSSKYFWLGVIVLGGLARSPSD